MRWNQLLAVALGLSVTNVASLGQRPPDRERLSSTSSEPDPSTAKDAGYFDSGGVVCFQLIHGRLCLDAPRHRKGAQNFEHGDLYESITITAERGVPSLHYVHRTADHEITLSVQHAQTVRIESLLPESNERAILEQNSGPRPGTEAMHWTVTRGDLHDQHDGATLLHLRNADPISFDRHYGQLFGRLLRGRTILRLSRETEAVLLEKVAAMPALDVNAVHQAIEGLSSPRSTVRRQSQRSLLSYGTTILPIVRQLSFEDLDAEQIERLEQIVKKIRPTVDDTPASLAAMLVNDRDHWTQLSSRLSHEQLHLANYRLNAMGMEQIVDAKDPIERIARGNE